MLSNKSNLSSPKYGYDFVVATTEASINSSLKEYLDTEAHPTTYVCFLADEQGNPSIQVTLEDLMKRSGNIDPFSIPDGTPTDDKRIVALTEARFSVGVKLQLGLPKDVLPKDLPKVVELGNSANNVTFNMLAKEFEVVENTPPGGFASKGSWKAWQQPSGAPWFFTTKVNLVVGDLDAALDTPYFRSHPRKKKDLMARLKGLAGSPFSLQQLLLDLDNAALQTTPTIKGLDPSSPAGTVLTSAFVNVYAANAKAYGTPLLSVHAVAESSDDSSLKLTALERAVMPLLGDNGTPVNKPSADQGKATTLNYLCMSGNPLPGVAQFGWNWVDPKNIGNQSGILAVNRNALARFYAAKLMPNVRKSCIKVATTVKVLTDIGDVLTGKVSYKAKLSAGQDPQVTYRESGPEVVELSYEGSDSAKDKYGATAGELRIKTPYSCKVSFENDTIKIVQNLKVSCYVRWDNTDNEANIFDTTMTDTYTLSVNQNGQIESTHKSSTADNSKEGDRNAFVNLFTGINELLNSLKKQIGKFAATQINDVPCATIRDFVFPGGAVFAFKSVRFSEYQDLLTDITYGDPK